MNRLHNYPEVNKLPLSALSVREYAAKEGIKKETVYNWLRRGKTVNFKIVIFQGFNFVIPN